MLRSTLTIDESLEHWRNSQYYWILVAPLRTTLDIYINYDSNFIFIFFLSFFCCFSVFVFTWITRRKQPAHTNAILRWNFGRRNQKIQLYFTFKKTKRDAKLKTKKKINKSQKLLAQIFRFEWNCRIRRIDLGDFCLLMVF